VEVDEHATTGSRAQVPSTEQITGVAALADGIVFIHDVEKFLSQSESETLAAALEARTHESATA
jgi:chemotaxis signal transduction protein